MVRRVCRDSGAHRVLKANTVTDAKVQGARDFLSQYWYFFVVFLALVVLTVVLVVRRRRKP